MPTIQQLVDKLNQGSQAQFSLVSPTPVEETAPVTVPSNTTTQTPATTVNRGTGRYYVTVQDTDGHQRALFLKPGPVPVSKPTGPGKSPIPGTPQVVQQTGVNDTVPDPTNADPSATKPNPNIYTGDLSKLDVWESGGPLADVPQAPNKPSPSNKLDKIDASGNVIPPGDTTTKVVTVRDPGTGTTFSVTPAGDKPSDPANWTPIADPNHPGVVAGMWDPVNNKMGATFAGDAAQKKSGVFTDIIDPNDPNQKRVIGKMDTGDKSVVAVARDPVLQKQVVTAGNNIYVLGDDGSVVNTIPFDPAKAQQAVTVGDQVYSFDPSNGSFTPGPRNKKPPVFVGGTADLPFNVTYDPDTGQELTRTKNPNYHEPNAVQPAVNTAARTILAPDPNDPSKLTWQENKAFMPASDALQQLAAHLSGQVVDKNISIDDAKAVIDAANARYTNDINEQNAQTQAAQVAGKAGGDIISRGTTNAQTGANLIQTRVNAATQMMNQVLGLAGQRSPSGNFGGGMLQAPAGFGTALAQGLQSYTADLAGGQSTMDSAARMVQQADPSSSMYDPNTQHAVGVLSQMLDKYQQLNGGVPHPGVQATAAAGASVAGGGMTAPAMATALSNPPGPSTQTAPPATPRPVQPAMPGVPALGQPTGPNLTPNNPYANVNTAGLTNPGGGSSLAGANTPDVYTGTGMVPAPGQVASGFTAPHTPITINVGTS